MNIIMLGHKRVPSREGGVEIVVEELAKRMVCLGHNVTVYNRKGHHVSGAENDRYTQKKYDYQGIHIDTVFTLPNKSLNAIVYAFFATVKAVFSRGEVIHFHAEGPCVMLPIAKLFRKNCVATIHGLDWQRAKWGGFATKILLFGEKMAARYADQVIVLSKGVQEYFRETYNRETTLIPNGIEKPEEMEPSIISQKYGLRGKDYILFLARLVPEKGAHTLVEAYEKSEVDVPLVIAGGSSHSNEYYQQIETMAERVNQGKKKIILTGFVEGRELQELYTNTLLYVLPSEIEGMPLSLLEAMSYGNVCLTSNISENLDVTGGYGHSFTVGDVDSLRCKLNSIYKTVDLSYAKEDIQKYILGKYSWDDVVKQTLEIYEGINCK